MQTLLSCLKMQYLCSRLSSSWLQTSTECFGFYFSWLFYKVAYFYWHFFIQCILIMLSLPQLLLDLPHTFNSKSSLSLKKNKNQEMHTHTHTHTHTHRERERERENKDTTTTTTTTTKPQNWKLVIYKHMTSKEKNTQKSKMRQKFSKNSRVCFVLTNYSWA